MNPSVALPARESALLVPQRSAAPTPSLHRASGLLAITLLWLAIYVAGMFSPPLLDDADTVHAEAAREMLLTHDWVTLHANGLRYLEKAPFMYWSVAASYKLFGVSEWSTRLPLMLGVLGLLLATYWFGSISFGEIGGLYSALVLATAVGPYLFTRFLIPDLLVALWITLGLLLFLQSLQEDRPSLWTCWGFAATCALNVLTKGLIGLVFPGVIIGLYLLLTGNFRHLWELRLFSSTLVFVAIAAPWHVLASLRNPTQGTVRGFLWFYFVNEHFLRYLNRRVPRDYDTVPLLVFWGLLLVWLFPWTVFLPQALKNVPARLRHLRDALGRRDQANLLCALWTIVILLFFTFSTRQEYYTIPAIPGLALLVGGWLQQESQSDANSPERRAGRISSTVLLGLGIVACLAGLALLFFSKPAAPGADLADLLRKNPQDYALSFGHFLDLTPQAMGAFRFPLLLFSVSLLLGSALNWFFRRRGSPQRGNLMLALMMVLLLGAVHFAFLTFSPILSSKALALAIQQHYRPGNIIVVDGEYESGSSLNFYTGVPLRILHEPSANLWYGSQFPDAPHVFETEDTFQALWSGPARVFLWTDQENPRELKGAKFFPLARSGGKFILTNRQRDK
ncbi:MAG TPA: glycosyltransferase family 39 protein [Terriglobales bacterium]|nr:glycosyltransferase family 39 protein [Terriglobales bacterium]